MLAIASHAQYGLPASELTLVPQMGLQLRLDTHLPFAELERRSRINAAAQAADDAADFSRRIRIGLPRAD